MEQELGVGFCLNLAVPERGVVRFAVDGDSKRSVAFRMCHVHQNQANARGCAEVRVEKNMPCRESMYLSGVVQLVSDRGFVVSLDRWGYTSRARLRLSGRVSITPPDLWRSSLGVSKYVL